MISIFIGLLTSYLLVFTRLSGTYVSNSKENADTLKLFSNGKYERKLLECGKNFIDGGMWIIKGNTIYFDDWIERCDEGKANLNGLKIIYATEVENRYFFGKTKLLINDDLELYYEKHD